MTTLLLKHERINTTNGKEETVTLEVETFADGTFHHTLGLTKRESEARQMAGWFLSKVEKMDNDGDPDNDYNKLQNQLIDLAISETGK